MTILSFMLAEMSMTKTMRRENVSISWYRRLPGVA